MDHLPEIKTIIRDAILDGLIVSESIGNFKRNCKRLKGYELEAYLQELWDSFPERPWNVPVTKDQSK